ncbi:MAG: beta-xylosidase [Daejeonella sp.]|nr:beta-xylosidase [Daejeonella sp.]
MMKNIMIVLVLLVELLLGKQNANAHNLVSKFKVTSKPDSIFLADPTIFFDKGKYYLYGTSGNEGFLVYVSKDLVNWNGPAGVQKGYALSKGDSFGSKGFWAPQILAYNNKFYMAYTANEHIAIAESNSPLGPFKQSKLDTISGSGKQIDPYIFIDDDGKKYLYHVRLKSGNRLFVVELKDDLSDIKPETLKECISGSQPWENTQNTNWPVTEGPTVLKHKSLYYLFYSANDFRNPDYAVGYATSKSPYGPWKKYNQNPIISRAQLPAIGTGHGDFIKDKSGNLYYVMHTHKSATQVSPRVTALIKVKFEKDGSNADKVTIDKSSFRYLKLK